MRGKKKFCIAIPVYLENIDPIERIGYERLKKVVGDKNYPIIFICPEGLDLSEYKKIYSKFEVFEFDKKWFKGLYEYSQLCMQYDFYNRFSDYEYMFMYQLDSYIWEDRIEEICDMGYDYIGGPIFSHLSNWDLVKDGIYSPKVGNGGCGWRKIETFKDICDPNGEFRQTYNITDEYLKNVKFEDKYFSNDIENKYELKKPSIQKTLSIVWDMSVPEIWNWIGENKFYPMCAHGIYKYPDFWKDKIEEYSSDEMFNYCIKRIGISLNRNKNIEEEK
jgi:hypothetical protein